MTREEQLARIRAAAADSRISCAAAMRLAEELHISRKEMGNLLNELHVKITQCQLGCF